MPPERGYRSAKGAVAKALELDDGMGEAHATLAFLSWRHEWDWERAEREFDGAIALAPSDGCARASHASFLAWRGRRAEALAEVTRSRELDPTSSYATEEAAVYYLLRDYERLTEASRRGVALGPNDWTDHYFLGVGLEGLGRRLEALPEYQKAVAMSGGDQDAVAALAHAYALVGRRAEAETMLRDMLRDSDHVYVSPYMVAAIHAGLGNKDKAFEFLQRAYRERCWDIAWHIKTDLRIDDLRSDPRFQSFLRSVGVSQS